MPDKINNSTNTTIHVMGKKSVGKSSVINVVLQFYPSYYNPYALSYNYCGLTQTIYGLDNVNPDHCIIAEYDYNERAYTQKLHIPDYGLSPDKNQFIYVLDGSQSPDVIKVEITQYEEEFKQLNSQNKDRLYVINKCDDETAKAKFSHLSNQLNLQDSIVMMSYKSNDTNDFWKAVDKFLPESVKQRKVTQSIVPAKQEQPADHKTPAASTGSGGSNSNSTTPRPDTPISALPAAAASTHSVSVPPPSRIVTPTRTISVSPKGGDRPASPDNKHHSVHQDTAGKIELKKFLTNKKTELENHKKTWNHWLFFNTTKTNAKITAIDTALKELETKNTTDEVKQTLANVLITEKYAAIRAHRSVGFFGYHSDLSSTMLSLVDIQQKYFATISAPDLKR